MTLWNGLFDARGFAPHGFCLFWDPDLVTLTLVANIGVAIACLAIPAQLALAAIGGRSGEVRLPRGMAILFGLAVLSGGISHLFTAITLFQPLYWLQAAAVMLAALVSLLTAALLPFELIRSRQGSHDGGHDASV